ncbi:unnamed protein product [Paramecium sonneborni]|uniref:H-type lectin domain-containing protein n=1 Tax=Paramecium sonneborni TaxID=65129 RepID=A0A8S1R6N7_9CILI|nr:unnamed protein product [Paramecium sonneborni]
MILELLFFCQVKVAISFITYDSGLSKAFDQYTGSGFYCQNGFTKTATTTFSGAFENIPQVFFTSEKYDLYGNSMEYQLSITSITQTSFNMYIKCGFQKMTTIYIRWFAIDDQRVEVLNNFNMNDPVDKTFSIKNPNAQTAFIVLTSIYYTGPIDFLLSITQITTNSVTVGITRVAGKIENLKQVGYQVVVGIEEAFINLGLQTSQTLYTSSVIPIQPQKWFVLALQGFDYPNLDGVRLNAVFTNTGTTLQYTWGKWGNLDTPNSHSQVWVSYIFTTSYLPLECFSLRTSRKFNPEISSIPTFYVEFASLNQIYTINGNYAYIVDKNVSPLKFIIQVKCQSDKKMLASFNKCNSCSGSLKTQSYNYQCSTQMNYVGFFPLFKQSFLQYNEIKILIEDSQLLIKQVTYNQKIEEQTLVNIEIQNQ